MRSESIILVENDRNLRQSITLLLEREGYLVTSTECVYDAIHLLQSGSYPLVISEMNIPETAQVLIPRILTSFPYISLVILTDQTHQEHPKEDRIYSAHYLIKPLAPERLLDCVRSILGHRGRSGHPNNGSQPGLLA